MGPDGRLQPKIPPNGEWQTHHPDGTTTKSSDDGFAPGTRDSDKHNLDPTDAQDRGKSSDKNKNDWMDTPGEGSGRTPREKTSDLRYLQEHYYLRRSSVGDWELVVKKNPEGAGWDNLKVKPVDLAVPPGWEPPKANIHLLRSVLVGAWCDGRSADARRLVMVRCFGSGGDGVGGIQGLPMMASRRTSMALWPCLMAVET
jgi:hypothetical protein